MGLDGLAPDEVVALHYDLPAVADDIALWCGGHVERIRTVGSDQVVVTVWVPTAKGPRPAAVGDWVVRHGEDDYSVQTGDTFAAGHTPL